MDHQIISRKINFTIRMAENMHGKEKGKGNEKNIEERKKYFEYKEKTLTNIIRSDFSFCPIAARPIYPSCCCLK